MEETGGLDEAAGGGNGGGMEDDDVFVAETQTFMDWVRLELRAQQRAARQDRLEFESYRKATDSKLYSISDALQLLLRRTGAVDIDSVNSSGPGATFTAAGNPVVAGHGTADARLALDPDGPGLGGVHGQHLPLADG